MDRLPPPRRPRGEATGERRAVATAMTLGLGALAGLAAYAAFAPAGAPLREPLRHPFGATPPRGNADDAPGRTARKARWGDMAVTGRSVTIDKPRAEIFAFWREFSNLARFMENIERVEERGDGTQGWTIRAPAGQTVEVVTRIVNEREGEQIAWRSTEASQIETGGKVMFRDAPAGRGTVVEAVIAYKPPFGEAGRLLAKLLQAEPSIQARRDLKRLKMLLETGEIATSQNRKESA